MPKEVATVQDAKTGEVLTGAVKDTSPGLFETLVLNIGTGGMLGPGGLLVDDDSVVTVTNGDRTATGRRVG